MKTIEDVKAELTRRGITAAAWARKHGVSPETVRGVILGRVKGRSGEAHKAAVLLGLKDGEIADGGDHE